MHPSQAAMSVVQSLSRSHRPAGSGVCTTDTEGYTHLVIPDESRRTLKVRPDERMVSALAAEFNRNHRTSDAKRRRRQAAAAAITYLLFLSFQLAQGREIEYVTSLSVQRDPPRGRAFLWLLMPFLLQVLFALCAPLSPNGRPPAVVTVSWLYASLEEGFFVDSEAFQPGRYVHYITGQHQ